MMVGFAWLPTGFGELEDVANPLAVVIKKETEEKVPEVISNCISH